MELVNTAGWIRFIGERNVKNIPDAEAYVQRIMNNPQVTYWVARRNEDQVRVGIVTLVKRDYLDCPDIGFALLPSFEGHGYAAEATAAVLQHLAATKQYDKLKAITLKDNTRSIQLLTRLGLDKETEMEQDGQLLVVFTTNLTEGSH